MTNINTDENKGFKKEPKGFIALSILLIIFVTASFMLFNSLLLRQANEIMQENILDNSIQTINNTASSITDSAKNFEDSLSVVSKAHSIEMLSDQTDKQAVQETLRLFKVYKETYKEIQNIYIGTADKRMYLYPEVELPIGYDPTSRVWYKNAMNNKGFTWSAPYIDAITGQAIITLTTPVYNQDKLVGVLSMDLNLSLMLEKVKEASLGKMGYAFVTDNNNIVISHPNLALIGKPLDVSALRELKNDDGKIRYSNNGEESFAVSAKIEKLNMNLIGLMQKAELAHSMTYLLNRVLLYGVLFVVFMTSLILFLIRRNRDMSYIRRDNENIYMGE